MKTVNTDRQWKLDSKVAGDIVDHSGIPILSTPLNQNLGLDEALKECKEIAKLAVEAPEMLRSIDYLLDLIERATGGLYNNAQGVMRAKAILDSLT